MIASEYAARPMPETKLEPRPLELGDNVRLSGEEIGEGPPIVLCHGLTATRRQLLHGSTALPRAGYRVITYDARGHGSSDPAPEDAGYTVPEMVSDLAAVIAQTVGEGRLVLGGHSMGAHTAVAYALEHSDRIAGLLVIGPAWGGPRDAEEDRRVQGRYDALADGLESGGVDGFLEVMERDGLDPQYREAILRFTRERMLAHEHPEAVVRALREVPRSRPFESMDELDFLEVPALVVASHDDADPSHPYGLAEDYAQHLPRARLISEQPGESPLAWQGGRLSREIAAFCAEPAVVSLLS
jgi:pimeloyl-ACP methyl ester carboxylesterase